MPDPDITLDQLFSADAENRRRLHNVIEVVQLDSGANYVDALELVHEAAGWARQSGEATLSGLLKHARGDTGAMQENLKLLDQRDAAVEEEQRRPAAKNKKLKRDPFGRVLLDQSYGKRPKSIDAHGRVTDPVEAGDRLRRAQRIWPNQYDGADGVARFELDDAQYLGAGVDMLKTVEIEGKEAKDQAQIADQRRQLDQAIALDNERRRELRQLDGQIDELAGRRRELEAPAEPEKSRFLLDQSGEPLDMSTVSKGARKVDKRARKRMRRLGLPETRLNYLNMLDAEARGEPLPKKSKAAPPASPVPPGVHPGTHAVHERVVARLRELDAPDSDYPKILEQILAEGA